MIYSRSDFKDILEILKKDKRSAVILGVLSIVISILLFWESYLLLYLFCYFGSLIYCYIYSVILGRRIYKIFRIIKD